MENWEILGDARTDDPHLNDCMVDLMEKPYYFENFPFGRTLESLADSFEIDAFYAGEDEDSGFSEIHEDDAIVEITAVFEDSTYCLGLSSARSRRMMICAWPMPTTEKTALPTRRRC